MTVTANSAFDRTWNPLAEDGSIRSLSLTDEDPGVTFDRLRAARSRAVLADPKPTSMRIAVQWWSTPDDESRPIDLFDERVSFVDIAKVFAAMQLAQHHTFLVVTGHPARMQAFYAWQRTDEGRSAWLSAVVSSPVSGHEGWSTAWPFRNIWLGVLVTSQQDVKRIPTLLDTPATLHFAWCEPIEPIDVIYPECLWPVGPDSCCSGWMCGCMGQPTDPPVLHGLGWFVVGGTINAAVHPEWARSLRDQCAKWKVPFHFRGWGPWMPAACPTASHKGERIVVHGDGQVMRNATWNDVMWNPVNAHGFELRRITPDPRHLYGEEHNAVPTPAPTFPPRGPK